MDLTAAHDLGLTIVRVPAYSPATVAEHTVGLILALKRKIHRAYNRVRLHDTLDWRKPMVCEQIQTAPYGCCTKTFPLRFAPSLPGVWH